MDNQTNQPVSLHPLMDFNQTFHAYDTPDGANCQTVFPEIMTQREAAVEAVRRNGLHQMREIEPEWFTGREGDYEMCRARLEILREVNR